MNITLQGTHFQLTQEVRDYVNEKIGDAFRAFGDMDLTPVEVAVELEMTTHHHRHDERLYRAEVNVAMPRRRLRAEASADDWRRAIVQVKHTLMREIRRWRERRIDEARKGARRATALTEDALPEDMTEEVWEFWEDEEEKAEDTGKAGWDDLAAPEEDERDFV